MIIPWFLTVTTPLSIDEVMLKLLRLTDQEVDIALGPMQDGSKSGKNSVFGGTVNFERQKFRLLENPHSARSYVGIKKIIQGSVEYESGKCIIRMCARASFSGSWLLLMFLWVTVVAIRQYLRGNYAWELTEVNIQIIGGLLVGWGLVAWNTVNAVKSTRALFERLFGTAANSRGHYPINPPTSLSP